MIIVYCPACGEDFTYSGQLNIAPGGEEIFECPTCKVELKVAFDYIEVNDYGGET
jgi:uncharacterized C2H2 Zn-finger protein